MRYAYAACLWCNTLVNDFDPKQRKIQIDWNTWTQRTGRGLQEKRGWSDLLDLFDQYGFMPVEERRRCLEPKRTPFASIQNSTPISRIKSASSSVYTKRSLSSRSVKSYSTLATDMDSGSDSYSESNSDEESPAKAKAKRTVAGAVRVVRRAEPTATPIACTRRQAAKRAMESVTEETPRKKVKLTLGFADKRSQSAPSSPSKPKQTPRQIAQEKAVQKRLKQVRKAVVSVRHPTQIKLAFTEEDEQDLISHLRGRSLHSLLPHAKARALLHVGSTPASLPCRESEFNQILEKVENAIDEGTGQCLYISGVPGTGKTATCRQVVRTLMRKRAGDAVQDFNFVEMNGMKISEASQVYSILWESISTTVGARPVGSKSALEKLRTHFEKYCAKNPSDKRKMTVLLLDEMDQLVTAKQDVIYNLFNWPNLANSKLVVIALANTMDLPQRALNAKVASRLGLQAVTFRPYTDKQLTQIVQARLGIASKDVVIPRKVLEMTKGCERTMESSAIAFMAKKVGNVNGDARRMLDVARRALEKVETEAAEKHLPEPRAVSIDHVRAVFDDMAKSGKTMHIQALPVHAKVLLWSAFSCVRKTGLQEVDLEDLHAHHIALCNNHRFSVTAPSPDVVIPRVQIETLQHPLALLCALNLLIAVGTNFASAHVGKKARFLLGVREDEVRFAFREDADRRFANLA